MGFLIKIWHIISTLVVVVPKAWPLVKLLAHKALDLFVNKKIKEKKEAELKEAAKVAEETGNTNLLESHLGTGSVVGDVKLVASSAIATESVPTSSDPIELVSDVLEEKKNLLETQTPSSSTGSTILNSAVKIAGVGIALYILDALINKKAAKAASVGFGANAGGVVLDGTDEIKNTVMFRGSYRMGSKLIP